MRNVLIIICLYVLLISTYTKNLRFLQSKSLEKNTKNRNNNIENENGPNFDNINQLDKNQNGQFGNNRPNQPENNQFENNDEKQPQNGQFGNNRPNFVFIYSRNLSDRRCLTDSVDTDHHNDRFLILKTIKIVGS